MATPDPRWLAVHRHRVRGLPAPYLLILQHHIVGGSTRIAAPLTKEAGQPPNLLTPRVAIAGGGFRAILLEVAAIPLRLILVPVTDAELDEDAITAALDAIFRGYPVGLPIA
jgi:hypothetical protein